MTSDDHPSTAAPRPAPTSPTERRAYEDRVVHEVDGIQEYDNHLPRWWLLTLFGSIAFAAVYWFAYHGAGFAELPLARYEREAAARAKAAAAAGVVTAAGLEAMARDPATVEQGKAVFAQNCVACHRADGGGSVGPNLTDAYWLHGSAPEAVYATIAKGITDKGMPTWLPQLGPERVQAATAYVLTLRGTDVAGGKAPQGEREAR